MVVPFDGGLAIVIMGTPEITHRLLPTDVRLVIVIMGAPPDPVLRWFGRERLS